MDGNDTDSVITHRIDAVPAPRLMRTIGATALSPTSAVAELVANSLDARVDDGQVNIEICISDGRIEVIDNGRGMTLEVLSEALRLGVDMDAGGSARSGRMGTYGLGMKTAAASLGDRWGIITRPIGVSVPTEFCAEFDLREWSTRGSSGDDWTISLTERLPQSSGPLAGSGHGTVIWIEALRMGHQLPGPYLDHLSRAFAPFLRVGNTITVNRQETQLPQPRLAEDTLRKFDEVIDEARGWVIRGWVGLDTKTHNDGLYGIDLYRNNQLIEIHNKDFFKPHLMTSRILGEAHLDFVPVNFNKVDFSKGTDEWKFARAAMEQLLRPLAEASRIMSRGRHDTSRRTKAIAKLNEAFRGPSSFVEVPPQAVGSDDQSDSSTGSNALEIPVRSQRVHASGRTIWLPTGTVQIDAQVSALEEQLVPWDYVVPNDRAQLLVVMNETSAVYRKMKDVDFLACIAVADCIARFLIERERIDPRKARRISNEWLHEAVTGNAVWIEEPATSLETGAVS